MRGYSYLENFEPFIIEYSTSLKKCPPFHTCLIQQCEHLIGDSISIETSASIIPLIVFCLILMAGYIQLPGMHVISDTPRSHHGAVDWR